MNPTLISQAIQPDMQSLLGLCERTRYSTLLQHTEHQAVLHTALLSWEIFDRQTHRASRLRVGIQEFLEGYPCLVVDAQASQMDLRWLIPLWQPAARPWLEAVQRQGQLQVMLQASDQPEFVTLLRLNAPSEDIEKLLALETPVLEDFHSCAEVMMLSGFRSMVAIHADPKQARRMRLAVACDPDSAESIYITFQQGAALVNRIFDGLASLPAH